MTATESRSITLQSQSPGTVANLTVVAVSQFGERLTVSKRVVFRVASINTMNSALIIQPQNGVVLQNADATMTLNPFDDAAITEQCQDSIEFSLAGNTHSAQAPNAFSWTTSIPDVGTYQLSTTYTNGLGTFTLNEREVR